MIPLDVIAWVVVGSLVTLIYVYLAVPKVRHPGRIVATGVAAALFGGFLSQAAGNDAFHGGAPMITSAIFAMASAVLYGIFATHRAHN